jgi:hypothetical protein
VEEPVPDRDGEGSRGECEEEDEPGEEKLPGGKGEGKRDDDGHERGAENPGQLLDLRQAVLSLVNAEGLQHHHLDDAHHRTGDDVLEDVQPEFPRHAKKTVQRAGESEVPQPVSENKSQHHQDEVSRWKQQRPGGTASLQGPVLSGSDQNRADGCLEKNLTMLRR